MSTQTRAAAPAASTSPRIAVLDVARGVAILGTLATNIWIFTNPAGMLGTFRDGVVPTLAGGFTGVVEFVFRELANGKFLGMLTLMFGIGLAIQQRSAERRGQRWPGRYPWRATLLLLDGVLHYVLVVEFDVLMGYAVTGLVVAFVLATSERAQRIWIGAQATVHVLLISLLTLAPTAGGPSGRAPWTLYTEGSWWDQVLFRLQNPGLLRAEPILILPLSITLFLLGARLYRAGLFDERGHRMRRVLVVVGAVALPLDLVLAATLDNPLFVTRYGTAPLVALGLLGAVAMLTERRRGPGLLQRRLGDIGRTALSCYVVQNIVASVLCYGWGLGLAPWLSAANPWGTLLLFAIVSMVVGSFAHLWLRRFSKGPLEAAWAWAYAAPWRIPTGGRHGS